MTKSGGSGSGTWSSRLQTLRLPKAMSTEDMIRSFVHEPPMHAGEIHLARTVNIISAEAADSSGMPDGPPLLMRFSPSRSMSSSFPHSLAKRPGPLTRALSLILTKPDSRGDRDGRRTKSSGSSGNDMGAPSILSRFLLRGRPQSAPPEALVPRSPPDLSMAFYQPETLQHSGSPSSRLPSSSPLTSWQHDDHDGRLELPANDAIEKPPQEETSRRSSESGHSGQYRSSIL
ncbi:hypothetical protein M231_00605 [Tremella mesenterica]|uniref:Uncharacterized protein n=1 Tax=Tremella mesenterica TaxID=5217 RepID=A0A4Q1BW17_TREME|nr:uncharacterized protein TREMEDRAFT_63186 [Tremella mesenterica DSM 1558]EIW68725.1 hypothetical protein TREMEDRAFT_63186 [Tremella mesenterica DSM 1558]RXK42246.1 hypothetical protein M231_00605 [Tremella mesenterica]